MATVEKFNKDTIRHFILITKTVPVIIAVVHLINSILSFMNCNDIPLNYFGGISFITIFYLYIASYTFKLCNYYRMFLHYSVIIDIINVYDYYFNIPISNADYIIVFVVITIITMLLILYLKFFK